MSALSGLLAGCSGEAAQTPVPAATSSAVTSTPSPETELPKAKFSRTMYATSTLKASTPLIDDCRGPVAIQLRGDRPVLVAEHDYCGGEEWIPRLAVGDAS
ncbi:hypothetical protein [Aeromicrobium sp. UC242_57]|uniref:hypothetical protein n=1 Tax=Aeromicrobium sp. UC242_57 TaxID=3374624 RepID=UPI0037B7B064